MSCHSPCGTILKAGFGPYALAFVPETIESVSSLEEAKQRAFQLKADAFTLCRIRVEQKDGTLYYMINGQSFREVTAELLGKGNYLHVFGRVVSLQALSPEERAKLDWRKYRTFIRLRDSSIMPVPTGAHRMVAALYDPETGEQTHEMDAGVLAMLPPKEPVQRVPVPVVMDSSIGLHSFPVPQDKPPVLNGEKCLACKRCMGKNL